MATQENPNRAAVTEKKRMVASQFFYASAVARSLPLHPRPLSQGEGARFMVFSVSQGLDPSQKRATLPPHPEGEGRGEGEDAQRRAGCSKTGTPRKRSQTHPLLLIAVLIVACVGCRTISTTTPNSAVYKVAFENDKVRVLEYHSGLEKDVCGFGMHTHPGHVYIMLTDAKLRTVTPDG